MSNWGMNFENHVPTFGRRLPEGRYLVEVAGNEADTAEKGDRIRVTFKVVEGVETGGTISTTLYILNDKFSGSEGHAGATKDNWYHLLVSAGVKPTSFNDMREVANALTGRRLGIEVVHNQNGEKTYANVQGFLPAAAMATAASTPAEVDTDDDDTPSTGLTLDAIG